jgi:hypothetical protein
MKQMFEIMFGHDHPFDQDFLPGLSFDFVALFQRFPPKEEFFSNRTDQNCSRRRA